MTKPTWEKLDDNIYKIRTDWLETSEYCQDEIMEEIEKYVKAQTKEITVKVGKKWRAKGIEIGKIRKAKEIEGEWKKRIEGWVKKTAITARITPRDRYVVNAKELLKLLTKEGV